MKDGLLLLNFGGPQGPTELEPFLKALFADVLPPVLRPLAGLVARRRTPLIGPAYAGIGWSPIVPTTARIADAVAAEVGLPTAIGMMFTEPSIRSAVDHLLAQGVERIVAVGLFPQWSLSTAGSAYDMLAEAVAGRVPVRTVPAFYDHPQYVEALSDTVRRGAATMPGDGPIHLLFSPHGLPLSFLRRGDPYPEQVRETARRVVAHLGWTDPWTLGWQSKVGPVRWLEPSTLDAIDRLAREGARRVLVVPQSFIGEGIETLFELDVEVAGHAEKAGVRHYGRCPAVGDGPALTACLADVTRRALAAFDAYTCVRCLLPKPRSDRALPACPTCGLKTPRYLRASA